MHDDSVCMCGWCGVVRPVTELTDENACVVCRACCECYALEDDPEHLREGYCRACRRRGRGPV